MTREMLELVMSISGVQLREVKANDGRKLSGVDANTRSHTLYLLPACSRADSARRLMKRQNTISSASYLWMTAVGAS